MSQNAGYITPPEEKKSSFNDTFAGMDQPRIRHITGIRIHQLTLPDALPLASKLVHTHEASNEIQPEGYFIDQNGSSSSRPKYTGSPQQDNIPLASPVSLRRQISSRSTHARERSTSVSNVNGSPIRIRTTRPRAPTLAGEVLEHLNDAENTGGLSLSQSHGTMLEIPEVIEVKTRRLARCFVVLKLPPKATLDTESEQEAKPSRNGQAVQGRVNGPQNTDTKSKGSVANIPSPQSSRTSRPPISTSSSRSSIRTPESSSSTTRTRHTSMTTPTPPRNQVGLELRRQISAVDSADRKGKGKASAPSSSRHATENNKLFRSSSDLGHSRVSPISRPDSPVQDRLKALPNGHSKIYLNGSSTSTNASRKPSNLETHTPSPKFQQKSVSHSTIPFFISPIHPPSTYPRFSSLEPGDFAPWLSVTEFASHQLELEVWYEDFSDESTEITWKRLQGIGGRLDLRNLRRVGKGDVPPNTLHFSLSLDPDSLFFTPDLASLDESVTKKRHTVKGIVERSMRETRMRKGVGLGALHQLVNMQAVISDTERDIAEVQAKIETLLKEDVDWRRLRRDINEREAKIRWVSSKITEVERLTEEVQATITLRNRELDNRRRKLRKAEDKDDLMRVKLSNLENEIDSVETEHSALLPAIHLSRATHVQTLDSLFPITPLHPPSLLYAILNVPLPIPIGPKDPAPPLSIPIQNLPKSDLLPSNLKIDEKSTATALGYVAMVVQILGNLMGSPTSTGGGGGLAYPVTCAGSRSLVKDVVSVMQGPRSFPLYAKGVERYRYEYAVFLLNKNIEMLMQDANLRLLDLRHTLPNLKALLLTLSSPVPLPSLNPRSGSSSTKYFVSSRTSSRQTSNAWSIPRGIRSATGSISSLGDLGSPGKHERRGSNVGTPSPLKIERRSRLARRMRGLRIDDDSGIESRDESVDDEVGDEDGYGDEADLESSKAE